MRTGASGHGRLGLLAGALLLMTGCSAGQMTISARSGGGTTTEPAATTVLTTTTVLPSTSVSTTTTVSATTTLPATVVSTGAPTTLHVPATRIVLVGDSLAVEASEYLPEFLGYSAFVGYHFGGTAPCDWFGTPTGASPQTVVVLSFHGNLLTPCATPPPGTQATVAWAVEKYRTDVGHLVDEGLAAGSDVILVGQPENAPTTVNPELIAALNAMYMQMAAERGIGYIDAGGADEGPAGEFEYRLPCLPEDPQCDADGMIAVRNPDGVHFCPVAAVRNDCPVYSSGAFRFARMIALLATVI